MALRNGGSPQAPDLYSRLEEAYDWVSTSLNELYVTATSEDFRPRAQQRASRGLDNAMQSVNGFLNQMGAGDCTASNMQPRCAHEPPEAAESIRRKDSWDAQGDAAASHRETPFARDAEELPEGPWDIPRERDRARPPTSSPQRPGHSQPQLSPGRKEISSPQQRIRPAYEPDPEDPIDQQLAVFVKYRPEVLEHGLRRKHPGVYEFEGRELRVEQSERGLVVLDGPLRQPIADYMECSERNAEYDVQGIGVDTSLHSIPKEKRMSFQDTHKVYSRLEAMKVAKEQALVRERAADYTKDGREVPRDLMTKYKKNLAQKLDPQHSRRKEREPQASAPSTAPAFPGPSAPASTVSSGPLPYQFASPAASTGYAPAAQAKPEPLRYPQLTPPNLFQPMVLSPPSGLSTTRPAYH